MVAAPTDFAITPLIPNSAAITLEWDHDGVDLDRFQLLYKKPGDDDYRNLLVAPAADFGAGPYSYDTASGQDFDWKVVALEADNSRSVTNPTANYDPSPIIDGIWLLPLRRRSALATGQVAYIRGDTPTARHPREVGEFDAPFSVERFTQAGVLHLREGTIDGALLDRNGQTPATWISRLRRLVKTQANFEKVMLATNREFFPVELFDLDEGPHPQIPLAYSVSIPYRELKR